MNHNNDINKDCFCFPCHKKLTSCLFCYCPIYPCGYTKLGKWIKTKDNKDVWDCSNCEILHDKEFVEKLRNKIVDSVHLKLKGFE